jgi:hypothetical protein
LVKTLWKIGGGTAQAEMQTRKSKPANNLLHDRSGSRKLNGHSILQVRNEEAVFRS